MSQQISRLATRYKRAFKAYQSIANYNSELSLTGGKPTQRSRLEEERAFETLDVARHALLDAAALVSPTIH